MATASAHLNSLLSRWIARSRAESADLDCVACGRPTKCCAYQPFVANFLVGGILEAGGSLHSESQDHYLPQPIGLVPTSVYRRRHAELAGGPDELALLCAFFNRTDRLCGIWRYRPAECSSFLCTPISEARKALSAAGHAVETAVAQMALAYHGYSRREIAAQIDFLNDRTQDRADNSFERLADLYRKTWHWACGVTRNQVESWLESEIERGG